MEFTPPRGDDHHIDRYMERLHGREAQGVRRGRGSGAKGWREVLAVVGWFDQERQVKED